jgi:hypothetical protein
MLESMLAVQISDKRYFINRSSVSNGRWDAGYRISYDSFSERTRKIHRVHVAKCKYTTGT